MSADEFTKLFKYMEERFKKIDERLEQTATKAELNLVMNAVDAVAKQTETYMHKMLALGHQVDRHERWILKTANAAGVNLTV